MNSGWFYIVGCVGAVGLSYGVLQSPNAGAAILLGVSFALLCFALIARNREDRKFLLSLFLGALALRWVLGALIYNIPALNFLGLDASTYDAFGQVLNLSWQGIVDANDPWLRNATSLNRSGWGMLYYVAAIYYLVGQNPLAVQLVTACLGAASAVIIYKVVQLMFHQPRMARTAAVLVALSPSMILWSSQALKDAPIVFCLSLCALYTLKLREKFRIRSLLLLILSLFALYSLRHYAFYILFISIAGALLIGAKNFTPTRILQASALVLILGVVFVYFGAKEVAKNFDLRDIQARRVYGAKEAKSGYGGEVDITDTKAAFSFLPIGTAYVLLAPFPWMIGNVRQLITLPELILWWLSLPLLIKGYAYAIRHRLKETFVICLFTVGLTVIYALYQTNVGTAYRHRAQMYIFFFIFISIGWEMRRSAKFSKRAKLSPWYDQMQSLHIIKTPATTARPVN